MEVRIATVQDISHYMLMGQAVQTWLRSKGLDQFVPSAHAEYAASIRERATTGSLFAVTEDGATVGFFSLDSQPSPWWPSDGPSALYLGGMVVDPHSRGRGVGSFIIDWARAQAQQKGRQAVRLDCHADNTWLCRYYESHRFELRGRVEQHPGYVGCLYELRIGTSAAKLDA